ncbi:hypothetical protein B0T17DRAFT_529666 [Bombardia bombarda]|uniref:Uncharacterized protein n=1 Tax=Bombardia bombarda TaxID=252184 RepID=A0AA39XBM8_9PEZI|nr:hypothetical protein B0T17DRAFT_529666 [Bombardia bombarda]
MSTHQTARTQYITTPGGTKLAYRRLGTSTPNTPLLILTHFRSVIYKLDPSSSTSSPPPAPSSPSTTPATASACPTPSPQQPSNLPTTSSSSSPSSARQKSTSSASASADTWNEALMKSIEKIITYENYFNATTMVRSVSGKRTEMLKWSTLEAGILFQCV